MKTKLLFLFLLFSVSKIFAQNYVFGKVSGESSEELAGVTVFNMRTEEKAFTDIHGNFMIRAEISDELRFIRKNYERFTLKISQKETTKSVNVVLQVSPMQIAEVEIKFKPTGNLRKDSKALDESPKVVALNKNMTVYMKGKPTEVLPKATIPSAFATPNNNAGQIGLLSVGSGSDGGFLGTIVNSIKKTANPKTTPTYNETQEFYKRIKQNIDLTYFRNFGLDEYELDEFIVYADRKFDLAKNFRKNFDVASINSLLRQAFKEYQKTHAIKS